MRSRSKRRRAPHSSSQDLRKEKRWKSLKPRRTALCRNPSTHSCLVIICLGQSQLIRVEVYFVYQTIRSRCFFELLFLFVRGKSMLCWQLGNIAKLMYLISQIMNGFSINKHTLRGRVLHWWRFWKRHVGMLLDWGANAIIATPFYPVVAQIWNKLSLNLTLQMN